MHQPKINLQLQSPEWSADQTLPLPIGFSSVAPLGEGESSDEECVRCRRGKLNCDGEQPCYPCVKAQPSPHVANCNYRRSDGTYESWAIRPFELKALGGLNLREDYEKYTGRRKSRAPGTLHDIRETSDTRQQEMKELVPSATQEIVDTDLDDNKIHTDQRVAKDNHKSFKFGLSAYSERTPPALQLKP